MPTKLLKMSWPKALLLASILGGLVITVQVLAFSPPTQSPPEGNVPAPINTGPLTQTKQGGLNLQGNLHLENGAVYQQAGQSGLQITCEADEALLGVTVSGGIITQGSCQKTATPAKRAFVTSVVFDDGYLAGIAGANAICQDRAQAAGLSGTWRAWVSSDTIDAVDNIGCSEEKTYQRLDGAILADSCSDLTDGSLDNPLNITENLSPASYYFTWTGTNRFGQNEGDSCKGWATSSFQKDGQVGYIFATSYWWTEAFDARCDGASIGAAGLYCFEN